MAEIENTSCVRIFMKETLVARIEIDDRNAASIIRIVTDGVYICKCSVRYNEYKFKTKHAFFL